jgi:S-adenosylmethionine:tRNA ribosyltransferase-isomerase
MHLSDYEYTLPPERIAQTPPARREMARLLVIHRATGDLEHRTIADLPGLLDPGDLLVLNDTRVIPSRLLGTREGHTGKVELLLLRPGEDPTLWNALARPARKLTPGTILLMGNSGLPLTVEAAPDDRHRLVRFPEGVDAAAFLREQGHMPLPPYIHREDTLEDRERYQTVFATHEGAVAAPTAGLHFTPELLESCATRGIGTAKVTLHVGLGTFAPVTEEDPRNHPMESERWQVPPVAAESINRTRREGGRVVAVGTTAVRTLETSAVSEGGAYRAEAGAGETRLFLHPPYEYKLVDALLTNFHLPRSTLLMLVAALLGRERMLEAYQVAIDEGYRFYSYGDAMLIL